jgi:putative endonuclease
MSRFLKIFFKRDFLSNFWKGKFAEFKAIFFLFILKFYLPIKIRYRSGQGEIDLICSHLFLRKIAFIEVKNRKDSRGDLLFESISKFQINRILVSAEIFLQKNPIYKNHDLEFYGVFFENLTFKKIFKIDI